MTTVPANTSFSVGSAVQDPKNVRKVGVGEDGTDKEMFLKLMIAQLQNQDPTAPMDQKDMMASITQYGQMEQMQNMSTAMETLSLTQGVGLIGKEIEYTQEVLNPSTNVKETKTFTGTVEHVEQAAGAIKLVLTMPPGANPGDPPVKIPPSIVTKVLGQ